MSEGLGLWQRFKNNGKALGRSLKKGGKVLGRLLIVPGIALATMVLGIASIMVLPDIMKKAICYLGVLAEWVGITFELPSADKLNKPLLIGATGVGVVVVIASVKELVNAIPEYWAYIKNSRQGNLSKAAATTFAAAFGLSIAAFSVEKITPENTIRIISTNYPLYSSVPDTSAIRLSVVFRKEAGIAAIDDPNDPSIAMDQVFQDFIKEFVRSLADCIVELDDKVIFTVQGFSSSSSLASTASSPSIVEKIDPLIGKRGTNSRSDAFNLWVSDRRRQDVHGKISSVIDEIRAHDPYVAEHFQVIPNPQSFQEMQAGARFSDRSPDGAYSFGRGYLTRRADIILEEVGNCRLPDRGVY